MVAAAEVGRRRRRRSPPIDGVAPVAAAPSDVTEGRGGAGAAPERISGNVNTRF